MTLRIAQITDCHLQADINTLYKGVDADAHLDQCLVWLAQNEIIDVLMLTGDLSHFGSADAYARLEQKVVLLDCPTIWLAGNHDDPELMALTCGQEVAKVRKFSYDSWQLITLDTNHDPDGRGSGSVAAADLVKLEALLAASAEEHVDTPPICIFMHHNAVPVNSLWQDDIMLSNGSEFTDLVAGYPQVKAVVCGHVHQEFDHQIDAARYLATPSSAVQFACQKNEFLVDEELGPGLRLFSLEPNGDLHTRVVRLEKQ